MILELDACSGWGRHATLNPIFRTFRLLIDDLDTRALNPNLASPPAKPDRAYRKRICFGVEQRPLAPALV